MTFDPESYEERVARFRWEIPDDFDFARDVVDVWAEDRSRLAACWPIGDAGEGRATFWDVRERSRRLAGLLASKGVGAGDGVAIVAPIGIDFAVALVAALRIGAVAMPVAANARTALALRASKPAAIVATASGARRLGRPKTRSRIVSGGHVPGWIDASAAHTASFDEPARGKRGAAAIAFGDVRHSMRWVFAQRWVADFWLDLRRTDLHGAVVSAAEPLGVATAILAPWMTGTAVAWRDVSARGDLSEWLARYPISTLAGPAKAYGEALGAKTVRRGELRHCVGLGPVAVALTHAWHRAVGLPIHTGFGSVDCPLLAAHLRGLPVRPGSIGRAFPGHEVLVIRPDSRECAPGEEGQLAIRGRPPTLADGTASDDVGIHRLGVRARSDEQGYLWLAESLA